MSNWESGSTADRPVGVGEWCDEEEEWLEEFPGEDAGGSTQGDVCGGDVVHADVVDVSGAVVHRGSKPEGGGK